MERSDYLEAAEAQIGDPTDWSLSARFKKKSKGVNKPLARGCSHRGYVVIVLLY